MALGEVLQRLSVQLALDTSEFATGSTAAQKKIGGLRDAITGLGDKWMQTGKRMSIGVTAPLAAFGLMSAKAASDAQELQSAFDQTFGDLSPMMDKWAQDTGDAMGRATSEMQQMANTFGIFFNQAAPTRKVAADMSQTFSVLAQDLASFYNVDPGTALDKLRSGLSGESEPLRDFGVFLNEAAVKSKALELGLGDLNGEITEQDKILARYNLILESTKNAQGDVARTSGSTANQARSFGAAMDELQVVIGTKLLPILTPLITGATKVLNAFTNLPSGVQTAIIAVGAMAAAIGPLMLIMGTLAATVLPLFAAKFGPIGLAISAFVNPLGTAISLLTQFALRMGALSIIGQIAPMLLRFAGPLGLIAAAGVLIYKNWDRISAVFSEFWARAQEALGPPLQELVATISGAFEKLWSGPLGDGIRVVMGFVQEFGKVVGSVLGEALIRILTAALEVVIYVFEQIGTAIEVVNALLNGDFKGAWEAAKGFVTNATTAFLNILNALAPGAVKAMAALYSGVKNWLQGKLGAVFDWVNKKIAVVKATFYDLYDAVVGNSYVPDMVDEIGQHMSRLDKLMVDPARKATDDTKQAFRDLAADAGALLDRLFPQAARLKQLRDELASIDQFEKAGLMNSDVASESRGQLGREYRSDTGLPTAQVPDWVTQDKPLIDNDQVQRSTDRMVEILAGGLEKAKGAFSAFKEFGAQAFDSLTYQLEGFLLGAQSAMDAVRNLVRELASMALRKFVFAPLGASLGIPGFANGTNYAPGGMAWVGERGPELVNLPRGSQVIPNHDLKGIGGGQTVHSPTFTFPGVTDERTARIAATQAARTYRRAMQGPLG